MKLKTNNVPRHTLAWNELTEAEQAEFDYMKLQNQRDCATFFRFKGSVYDLGEFERYDDPSSFMGSRGWHGFSAQSAFHAVAVKFPNNDTCTVIVGQVFA